MSDKKPIAEPETILTGIAKEILDSDEFKRTLAELGPDKIRENIERGLARLDQRAVEAARRMVRK